MGAAVPVAEVAAVGAGLIVAPAKNPAAEEIPVSAVATWHLFACCPGPPKSAELLAMCEKFLDLDHGLEALVDVVVPFACGSAS